MNYTEEISCIRVYRTDVENRRDVRFFTEQIRQKIPQSDVSFDLDDCDNVLRIESRNRDFSDRIVRQIFEQHGHFAEVLPF